MRLTFIKSSKKNEIFKKKRQVQSQSHSKKKNIEKATTSRVRGKY